jgi:hypothetical protein
MLGWPWMKSLQNCEPESTFSRVVLEVEPRTSGMLTLALTLSLNPSPNLSSSIFFYIIVDLKNFFIIVLG